MIEIIPAIDVIDGKCVRLAQGDFARETKYSDDPAAALGDFADGGAVEAHLVDLDGARAREPRQHELFIALARTTSLALQVAGGFRTIEQVRRILDAGVARVVIGSLAIDDPDAFARMIDEFGPDRLTLALDVRIEDGIPLVATHGWATGSGESLETVLGRHRSVRHLLVTDIARDGRRFAFKVASPLWSRAELELQNAAMDHLAAALVAATVRAFVSGVVVVDDLAAARAIVAAHPAVALQASGGVAALGDLTELANAGAARAIVGKAIWEQRFTVADAVAYAQR